MQGHRHHQLQTSRDASPSPANRLMTASKPTRLVFRETYPGGFDDNDSEAVRRLRRVLESLSAVTNSQYLQISESADDLACDDAMSDAQSVCEDIEYEDGGVVVEHVGQRLLPVLVLKRRWKKRKARSALACFCLSIRHKVLRSVKKAWRSLGRTKSALLC